MSPTAQATSGARRILETAAAAGVEVCFANPGTTEMPLVAALDETPEIRAVLCLFEGVCTGAADGYARMTRRPALTLLHLGPGFANGIANLHNARRARSPIVNLIGDQASWHLASDAPLTSDIESLARPVSGWVRTGSDAAQLSGDMSDAIRASQSAPCSISTYVIPADFQADEGGPLAPALTPEPFAPVSQQRTLEVASRAKQAGDRCVLLLGGRALDEAGQQAAADTAAALGGRVFVETFPARWERGGGLPAFERLPYFPEQARAALAEAEVVILAGAREPVAFFGYPGQRSELAPEGTCVVLAGADEAASPALEALARALDAPRATGPTPVDAEMPVGPLTPPAVGSVLARALPSDAIVVEEAATSSLPFYGASTTAARHTLLSLTGGAIGQGLPVATGAAIACPDRQVISFQADGSAAYTLQALWTQAREQLDVVTLLCSNNAYRILQIELSRAGVTEPGPKARALTRLDEPTLNWVAAATAFGVPAERIETAEQLVEALPRALASRGPKLLELAL